MSSVAKHPDPTTALKHLFLCTLKATERFCLALAASGARSGPRKRFPAPASFSSNNILLMGHHLQRALLPSPREQAPLSAPCQSENPGVPRAHKPRLSGDKAPSARPYLNGDFLGQHQEPGKAPDPRRERIPKEAIDRPREPREKRS